MFVFTSEMQYEPIGLFNLRIFTTKCKCVNSLPNVHMYDKQCASFISFDISIAAKCNSVYTELMLIHSTGALLNQIYFSVASDENQCHMLWTVDKLIIYVKWFNLSGKNRRLII